VGGDNVIDRRIVEVLTAHWTVLFKVVDYFWVPRHMLSVPSKLLLVSGEYKLSV